ncbi:MAG TPA: cobalamin-dependent protein, partial [Gammaproteobacteria bacterium]|nr:cobalamin-dependent protein [Gammaproteobacteria bacterium]
MSTVVPKSDTSELAQAARLPLRFVTAASLFDGHDAAINIMRRIIQSQGAEVIHLGHNRSVEDVVRAALQEDADAVAISSYQGGHIEYFKYMVDMLRDRGAGHVRVFGGGGGTITPEEIAELEQYGVERLYHPNDGMHMGLVHMIEDVVGRTRERRVAPAKPVKVSADDELSVGRMLTALEAGVLSEPELTRLRKQWELAGRKVPVVGVTGTGGAGKSSVVDELLLRFLHAFPGMRIAVLAVDPTRRRTGGALLGDRIRMNALRSHRVFMRSMATRRAHAATNAMLKDCIAFLCGQGYDLVLVETAGIGQSDSEIVDLVDFAMYVMTPEFGAPIQLEKIDMLDYADLVVLNKYDRRGADDALRDVRKQWKRNRTAFKLPDEEVPVYPTIASQFNDPGVTWMFVNLCRLLREKLNLHPSPSAGSLPSPSGRGAVSLNPSPRGGGTEGEGGRCDFNPQVDTSLKEPRATILIPGKRVRYLAEIAEQGRGINKDIDREAEAAGRAQHYYEVLRELGDPELPKELGLYNAKDLLPSPSGRGAGGEGAQPSQHSDSTPGTGPHPAQGATLSRGERDSEAERALVILRQRYNEAIKELSSEALHLLREWPERLKSVTDEHYTYEVRGKPVEGNNYIESLSHQKIPKIAGPNY